MNYKEFRQKVFDNIKDHLSEEYQGYEMRFQDVRKGAGNEYEALMISPKDRKMTMTPALNLTNAYKEYENGTPFDEILDKLATIRMHSTLPNFNKEDILDYNKIKDRIIPRLINTEANQDYLTDKPHKNIEDLSIVYAVRVSEDEQGFADAVITKDLAEMWGVSALDLHEKAMENISERPPVFQNIESVLFGEKEDLEIEDVEPEDYTVPYFVLTNQQKTKGAVMAINPKTMDRITAKLGDVYVIPSSVDETLIVPKRYVEDLEGLQRMVRQINANEVRPEDQLSNNIYEYDPRTHTLRIAGSSQTQNNDTTVDGPELINDEAKNSGEDQAPQSMTL